jgi:hypothetical protein
MSTVRVGNQVAAVSSRKPARARIASCVTAKNDRAIIASQESHLVFLRKFSNRDFDGGEISRSGETVNEDSFAEGIGVENRGAGNSELIDVADLRPLAEDGVHVVGKNGNGSSTLIEKRSDILTNGGLQSVLDVVLPELVPDEGSTNNRLSVVGVLEAHLNISEESRGRNNDGALRGAVLTSDGFCDLDGDVGDRPSAGNGARGLSVEKTDARRKDARSGVREGSQSKDWVVDDDLMNGSGCGVCRGGDGSEGDISLGEGGEAESVVVDDAGVQRGKRTVEGRS